MRRDLNTGRTSHAELWESALRAKKVCNLVAFSALTRSCNYHLYLVPEHSIAPKRNPVPTKQSLPVLPFPGLCRHPSALSLDFPVLDDLTQTESDNSTAFRDWLLSLSPAFSGLTLPRRVAAPSPFIAGVERPQRVCPSICGWTRGLFPPAGIGSEAALNIRVQGLFGHQLPLLWGTPVSGIAES